MGRKSIFSREEKIAAVKLVKESGRKVKSVASEYGIHENTLCKWRRQLATNPERAFTGEILNPNSEERLQRRIDELEREVAFLKKVSAYFAKNPQ